jgi:hypothetical protein
MSTVKIIRKLSDSDSPNEEEKDPKKLKMSVEDSLISINQSLQTLAMGQNEVKNELSFVKGGLVNILARLDTYEKQITNVMAEVSALKYDLNALQQEQLRRTFLITGLPYAKTGEMAFDLVKSFFKISGTDITEDDLQRAFIVGHRNNTTSHIVANFYSEYKRDTAFKRHREYSKNKPVLVADLYKLPPNDPNPTRQLRLRSQLTPITRDLLNKARSFAYDASNKIFEHAWEKDGKILIQITEGSKPKYVTSMDQLMKLVGKQQAE